MAAPNFPQKPVRNYQSDSFPADLVSGGRQIYTNISFGKYAFNWAAMGGGALSMGGSVKLPIPRKLNDNETILWEEWSGTQQLSSVIGGASQMVGNLAGFPRLGQFAGSVAGNLAGAIDMAGTFTGKSANPFQFMMFKRPGFKEHVLQWALAPSSEQESQTLKRIINRMKKAALPTASSGMAGIALMEYPEIAMVSFRPNEYLYKMKPCAIISVQVDYTGNGPSFFRNGAPTVVGLTIQLKELQLWKADDPELIP